MKTIRGCSLITTRDGSLKLELGHRMKGAGGASLRSKPMLPCMSGRFSNGPLLLKFMIEELHPFLSLSLMNIAKFKICVCYINRISNELLLLSLNGIINNFV